MKLLHRVFGYPQYQDLQLNVLSFWDAGAFKVRVRIELTERCMKANVMVHVRREGTASWDHWFDWCNIDGNRCWYIIAGPGSGPNDSPDDRYIQMGSEPQYEVYGELEKQAIEHFIRITDGNCD